MKQLYKDITEGGNKKAALGNISLIIWLLCVFMAIVWLLVVVFFLPIFNRGAAVGNLWTSLPIGISSLLFIPSFIIWVVLKLEKRLKVLGIICSACLFIMVIGLLLLGLGVGNVQNTAQLYMLIPMILSFVVFMLLFIILLILKFKKRVIVPVVLLILIVAASAVLYLTKMSEQRQVACNAILQENIASTAWLKDWGVKNDQINAELGSLSKSPSSTNLPRIISDYQTLRTQNKEFYDNYKVLVDTYSKYLTLFTDYDMSSIYKSIQNSYQANDDYYALTIDGFQNVSKAAQSSELKNTYDQKFADINSKVTATQKDFSSTNGALTNIGNIISFRCYDLFKINIIPPDSNK